MSDHIQKTVEDLQAQIKTQEADLIAKKKLVNQLCQMAGMAEVYAGASLAAESTSAALRSDQFYGKPLATAVREVLELRKAAGFGATPVNTIYSTLKDGGFKFDTKDDENAKRNLRISLTKNGTVFHKLPNGDWGLLSWYPNAKATKKDEGEEEPAKPAAAPAESGKPSAATETKK
jgi:hypothetical protein